MRRLLAAAVLAFVAACGPPPADPAPAPVTVFAAASLETALADLDVTVFQPRGHRVRLTYAGTPQLARQIAAGAPADIFISADERWMDTLVRAGQVQAPSRRLLLGNALVLIAPRSSAVVVDVGSAASWRAALGDGRLAIADPENVPAGRYARETLTHARVWNA
ncbi:MAG TPA: molybdate ABC transporter substrate-binding protein, partial [Luteitalea sp.]|nr:molybdate ABC transporter substrate-binding protein [Luteitalea sp.]